MPSEDNKRSATSASATTTSPHATTNTSAARLDRHYEVTRDGLTVFFGTVKDISEATEMLAPLKATCALLIRALELTKSINDNKSALITFNTTLQDQLKFFKTFTAEIDKEGRAEALLRPALAPYEEEVNAICKEAARVKSKMDAGSGITALLRRIGRNKLDSEKVNRWTDRVNTAHKYLTMSFQMVISTQLLGASQDLKAIRQDLKDLSVSMYRPSKYAHDSLNRSIYGLDLDRCEPGTRTDVLERIRQWGNDATEKQVFWLSGDKGVGKTTIAVTISREWIDNGSLGGRFFFSQDDRATSTTHEFCRAVARDIATHHPLLEPIIEAAIASTSVKHFPLEQQLQRMIIEPVGRYSQPIIIVVDGLDSVADPHLRHGLLKCLMKELPRAPALKVLFSGPAFMDIEEVLGNPELVQRYDVQLSDTSDPTIHSDTTVYIEKHLKMLTEGTNGQIGQKAIVATLSQGSFIWLVPAAFLLKKSKRRQDLIALMSSVDPPNHLDHLYYISIDRVTHGMWHSDLKMDLLRIITIVMEPISLRTLYHLLPDRNQSNLDVERMVRLLGGVIKSGDPNLPVRVRHSSFREFCLSPARAKEYYVDSAVSHGLLTLTCLNSLVPFLHYNILGIDLHGVLPRNQQISNSHDTLRKSLEDAPVVGYASSHWPFHAANALENNDVISMASDFIRNQLLSWIELMSWRGQIECVIDGLSCLELAFVSIAPTGEDALELQVLITQALSFVKANDCIVVRSAMQAYCSALGFAVDSGPLFQGYRELHKGQCPKVVVTARSGSYSGSSMSVPALAISPDGKLVANVASDSTLELWMTSTGELNKIGLPGHPANISSLDFSVDGQLLGTGSVDGKLQIWSTTTGSEVHSLEHPGPIVELKFSPARPSIAVIYRDTERDNQPTLRLWDLAAAGGSGTSPVTMCGMSTEVMGFSFDGRYIATLTEQGSFMVYETSSGALLHSAETGVHPSNIALSSDGSRLAISSTLQIQLWDLASPPPRQITSMQPTTSGATFELSISLNGKYLIYGPTVWDIEECPTTLWNGFRLPAALQRHTRGPGSLLSYQDGWIHSVFPRGPLLEVPPYYGVNSSIPWRAHGSKIIFAAENGNLIMVDCSHLLS